MKNFKQHFTTIVLCCYALFLFFLLSTGAISKFINPKLSFLSVTALLIICAMIFSNFTKAFRKSVHSSTCHCYHHEKEKVEISSYLLFLPIVLSVMITPGTLGYQPDNNPNFTNTTIVKNTNIPTTTSINKNGVIIIRYKNQNQFANSTTNNTYNNPSNIANPNTNGVNNNQSQNTADVQDMVSQFVPAGYEEYTQLNIGDTIFDTLKAPKQKLTQAKIFLRGKVLKSANLKKNEIVLYRVVISCCAADGIPLGVLVQLPQNEKFTPDEWVGVEGTIQLLPFNNQLKDIDPIAAMVTPEKIFPYFIATKAYRVQPPRDEYLFP
jgi:putative membrane protein